MICMQLGRHIQMHRLLCGQQKKKYGQHATTTKNSSFIMKQIPYFNLHLNQDETVTLFELQAKYQLERKHHLVL